jgi:hypothetical protein
MKYNGPDLFITKTDDQVQCGTPYTYELLPLSNSQGVCKHHKITESWLSNLTVGKSQKDITPHTVISAAEVRLLLAQLGNTWIIAA